MDELLIYAGIALALFVVVLLAVVVSQRARMKRFEAKLGMTGVGLTVELSDLVKKEVARVSLASLGRIARVDRELIPDGHPKSPTRGHLKLLHLK